MPAYNLQEIASKFCTYKVIEPYGDGHINDTYIAYANKRYILQKINSNIFLSPEDVMENIKLVTEHVRNKLIERNGDVARGTLKVIPTLDGKSFYKTENGEYFRMYEFIENALSYSKTDSPDIFYSAGKGFGEFFDLLSDFDATQLKETIKNFHYTPARYEALCEAIENDKCGRAKTATPEIEFALAHKDMASVITDLIESGDIPLRVTHNDTKLNNIMLDNDTKEPVCVIDLDTVMPGSILYDFGDSIRFGASSAEEDEHDLNKVYCDMDLFEAFTRGFLENTRKFLTQKEIELLVFSARLLTYECGIRFLADYLNGDTYFKTHYTGQNLFRARTQFKLISDMEAKEQIMQDIVKRYV